MYYWAMMIIHYRIDEKCTECVRTMSWIPDPALAGAAHLSWRWVTHCPQLQTQINAI